MKSTTVLSGDLCRISDCKIIREKYSYTFAKIENRLQLRATIRNGGNAWPGGYPLYLIFGDGEPCCFECARKEYPRIARDMKEGYDASFQILGCEINYEDEDMHCAHCNKRIESAYAESEYAVIVGNIGTAYTCSNEDAARKVFAEYVQDSKAQYGRCAGENVTLTCDGEPLEEFNGKVRPRYRVAVTLEDGSTATLTSGPACVHEWGKSQAYKHAADYRKLWKRAARVEKL